MIKTATIVRPERLNGIYTTSHFIPTNAKDQLIEVDMGFNMNPVYKQEKLIYFLPDNIYYQKLALTDGKGNAVKDDVRTIVISGQIEVSTPIFFNIDIYPALSAGTTFNDGSIDLPFYPEVDTGIVIRGDDKNKFYYFSVSKVLHRSTKPPLLQLRYMDQFTYANLGAVLHKWHRDSILELNELATIQQ